MYIAKDREASRSWTFDFAPQLAVGETVVSGTVTVLSGTTDVSSTVVGTVAVAPPGGLTFQLRNAYANAEQAPGIYDLFLDATTSTGRRLTEDGQVVITGDTVLHNPPVGSVTLSPASPSIVVGGSQQMTASATDPKGGAVTGLPTTWASSNTAIATVDANGKVAALAFGTCTISATIGGVTQSVTLTVTLHTTQLVAQETVVALIVGHVRNGAYAPKDANGNVTTDSVTYSSSNAAVATVDANGQITPVAAGGPVTITATCGAVTQSRTLTCYNALVPTLAWEPLPANNQPWPRVWTQDPHQTANQGTWAQPWYAGGLMLNRQVPYSPDRYVLADGGSGESVGFDPGGFAGAVNASYTVNTDSLPFDANPTPRSLRFTFSAAPGAIWGGWPAQSHKNATDPVSPLRRYGNGFMVRATSAADVGKTIDFIVGPNNDLTNVKVRRTITLASNTQWQWAYVDARNAAELSAGMLWGIATGSQGATAMAVDVIYQEFVGGLGEDCLTGWGGFLTQFGLPAEMSNVNAWPPDSNAPALYNGATSGPTTEFQPDGAIYFDGSPFTDYWMPSGGGIMSPGPCNLKNVANDGNPVKALWIMCYVKPNAGGHMPNDGDLQATLVITGNAHTYGPINLVRDPTQLRRSADGASWYRARVPINANNEGYAIGTAYIKNATSGVLAVTVGNCALVAEDSRTEGWHQSLTPRRNLRVQPPTGVSVATAATGGTLAAGTYYYVVTALDPAGESLGSTEVSITTTGTTSKNTLTWQAVSGATGYNVYRGTAAGGENVYYAPGNVLAYADTNAASTAGSPPTTAPWVWQALAWMENRDVSNVLSVDAGVMGVRLVIPYAVGDVINLGMLGGPGVWQTGPIGSSDFNFDCSFDPNSTSPRIIITMNRAVAGYDSWRVIITIPNGSTYLPAWNAFDIVCAWQNRQLVAVGIGSGAGSDITWIPNGGTYLGTVVTYEQVAGTTWEFSTTGSHILGWADRDQTRVTGGFFQAMLCGKTVPATVAETEAIIEEHVREYWGARPSY